LVQTKFRLHEIEKKGLTVTAGDAGASQFATRGTPMPKNRYHPACRPNMGRWCEIKRRGWRQNFQL